MNAIIALIRRIASSKLATVETVMEAHRSTIENLKAVTTSHTRKAEEHAKEIAAHTAQKAAAELEAVRASKIAAKMEAIFD